MSNIFRIKVIHARPNDNLAKKLLGIYYALNIKILNIETVKDGFFLLVGDLKEGEKIFDENSKRAANNAEFYPEESKDIICERTLFVKVSKFILFHTRDEILTELRACNRDLKILDATKLNNSSKLKLRVDHSNTADKIMNQGIGMFNLHTPGSSISKENNVEVIKCVNCFQYNDHTSRSCPKPKKLMCTICLGAHFYRDCQVNENDAVCFHCGENHHAFAHSCKVRKQLVEHLIAQSQPKTYASATRNMEIFERRPSAMYSPPPARPRPLLPLPPHPQWTPKASPQLPPDMTVPPPPPPPFPLHPDTANLMISVMSKTSAVIQLALHSATTEPNSFMKTYVELCKSNNLPILNLDDYKPFNSADTKQQENTDGFDRAPAEDLDSTSFMSADGESLLTRKTQNAQISVNNASSPFTTLPNKENSQLNTSPTSPIEKLGNRVSLDDFNIPTYPRQMGTKSATAHCSVPTTQGGVPFDRPPQDRMPVNITAGMMTITSASADAHPSTLSPSRNTPLNATSSPHTPPLPLNEVITPLVPKTRNSTPSPLKSPLPLSDVVTTQRQISRNTTPTAKSPTPPQASDATPPLVIPPHTIIDRVDKSESDNNYLAEIDDKFELFTTKRTRLANMSQLKKWRNDGYLAIKRNGKLVQNKKEIDLILANKFEALIDSKLVINNDEFRRIVENCS